MHNDESVTIRLKGVSKSFGETRALQSVDFEAVAGEVHAVVGENGSGKSTLAKIMAGVLLPDAGEVNVLGIAPRNPIQACEAGLAMIFQEILVADEASVLDNLFVGRDPLLAMSSSQRARAREAAIMLERFVGAPVNLNGLVAKSTAQHQTMDRHRTRFSSPTTRSYSRRVFGGA